MFSPTLLLPESTGCVLLKSKDPMEYPCIHPNYLQKEKDMEILVHIYKFCRKMAKETKVTNNEKQQLCIPHLSLV